SVSLPTQAQRRATVCSHESATPVTCQGVRAQGVFSSGRGARSGLEGIGAFASVGSQATKRSLWSAGALCPSAASRTDVSALRSASGFAFQGEGCAEDAWRFGRPERPAGGAASAGASPQTTNELSIIPA